MFNRDRQKYNEQIIFAKVLLDHFEDMSSIDDDILQNVNDIILEMTNIRSNDRRYLPNIVLVNLARAYWVRAKHYFDHGQFALALQDYKNVDKLNPNKDEVREAIAACEKHVKVEKPMPEYLKLAQSGAGFHKAAVNQKPHSPRNIPSHHHLTQPGGKTGRK